MLIYFVRHGQTEDNRRGIIQGHLDTHLNDHGRRESALAARALARAGFVEAWSSSLSRARETAQIILEKHDGIELQQDPGLMERFLGSLQGDRRGAGQALPPDVEPTDDFRKRIAAWVSKFLAMHYDAELQASAEPDESSSTESSALNGHPIHGVDTSTSGQSTPQALPGERPILVVSHGAYMKALLIVLLSPAFGFTVADGVDIRESVWNTSIMRVRVRPRRSAVAAGTGSEGEASARATSGGADDATRWEGSVLSWGDVRHLEKEGEWEDVGVADDVR